MGACKQPTTQHVEDGDKGCMAGEPIPITTIRDLLCSPELGTSPLCALHETCIANPQHYELIEAWIAAEELPAAFAGLVARVDACSATRQELHRLEWEARQRETEVRDLQTVRQHLAAQKSCG